MPFRDESMKWKPKRKFFRAALAHDIIGTSGADTGQNAGGPVVAVAAGGSGFAVVQIAAQNDEIEFFFPKPYDLDPDGLVLGRVVFIHASTDADAPIFTVKSKLHAKQATVVDLDTSDDQSVAFAAHTCSTTTSSLEITDWTDLKWDESWARNTDAFIGLILACTDLGSASANEIEVVGFEIMYNVDKMETKGAKPSTESALLTQPL